MGRASVNLTQLAPKAAALCEITRNDGYWAFKITDLSRSPILILTESWYATSC